MTTIERTSRSESQTRAIGDAIGSSLDVGAVVALAGELGAGKTRLAKGLAVGLGVDGDRTVNSPTFVLVNQYAGRCPVYHLDLYRLPPEADLTSLGFDEMCDGRAAVIVEWADRSPKAMPNDALWIRMTATDETTRSLTLTTTDDELADRLQRALAGITDTTTA